MVNLDVPFSIKLLFGLTTLITVSIFLRASHLSRATLILLPAWLIIQCLVGISGFYTVTNTLPPRFLLLIAPPFVLIGCLFFMKKGRGYIDRLDQQALTLLHAVRIPVEFVLYLLFIQKTVPGVMTFEGRNFDIISGITAPLIFYFGFVSRQLSRKAILVWNCICLGLLINIVVIAVLSAPFPFQKLAFDQPNIAVLYFPFIWLPCCVVPLVLFSHLASIRNYFMENRKVIAKDQDN